MVRPWLVNQLYTPPKPTMDTTPNWRDCKLLGSYIDTKKDIENRKKLTLQGMRKFENVFKSNKISRRTKIKTFNIYISCIFLYNSELWGMTKTTENQINAFQRRLQRYTIGIQWPEKISNNNLQNIMKTEQWSLTIKRRRLTFLGHIMRLHHNTPVRKSLSECIKESPNKRGKYVAKNNKSRLSNREYYY